MSPTSYSQALSPLTRGVALLKSIPEVPKRQVDKTADSSIYVLVVVVRFFQPG